MLTKYYIEIDGTKHEIPQRCIKNWDEVKCAYKRADYSGITRSFTSQFEFVNEAYDMIMALYLRDGFNASAILSLYTITDRWEWEERFSAPLDFSSLTWDSHILKVNCIDNSLAALIKSRKTTKYELVVGQDILVEDKLLYDRVAMINSCAHEIMGNGIDNRYGDEVDLYPSNLAPLPTYIVGDSETYENSPILFQDQTSEQGSCFLEVLNSVSELEITIRVSSNGHTANRNIINSCYIFLMQSNKNNQNSQQLGTVFYYSNTDPTRKYLGVFPTYDALQRKHPNAEPNSWALIGTSKQDASAAYVMSVGNNKKWERGNLHRYGSRGVWEYGCPTVIYDYTFKLSNLSAGKCFSLFYVCDINSNGGLRQPFISIKSSIQTKWLSKAKTIEIDSIRPEAVLAALADKICDGRINVQPQIDFSDSRLSKTFILAAESVRNIPGAKFYSSFQEFCNWMGAVFGYTYYLGPLEKSLFKRTQEYSLEWPISATDHLIHSMCPGGHGEQVVIIEGTPYFAVLGDDYNADGSLNFYTKWNGSDVYNDPITGKARLDTLFYDEYYNQGCYFDADYKLQSYSGDIKQSILDSQKIYFVHRNTLFQESNIVRVNGIRDLRYSISKDFVVSTVIAGYEKQEYDAECGRDEWNFSAQYNTGVDLVEKKIELVSKYRADCYGLEFLAQKRAKDTTDTKSDNTVFFVHCKETTKDYGGDEDTIETKWLEVDRSVSIRGALTDTVFNGEYSPIKCIQSNERYLSAIKRNLTLKFASFDGNTNIGIDGTYGNSDLYLSSQLFTAGEIEFTSGDTDMPIDSTALYEVEHNGVIYRGYLLEATFRFSINEAVKYKLIVKDIEV